MCWTTPPICGANSAFERKNEVAKRISLVVTYDTGSREFFVDADSTEVHFPEGLCWDHETEYWADEPDLVEDVVRRLIVQLIAPVPLSPSNAREPISIATKFTELALNIIDPDCKWDPEETLEFSDAAREFLSEYPISDWEMGVAFVLAHRFIHDWTRDETLDPIYAELAAVNSPSNKLATPEHLLVANTSFLQREPGSSLGDIGACQATSHVRLTTVDTKDLASGLALQMVFGDYEGTSALALFVGDIEEPILIDRKSLETVLEEGWEVVPNSDDLACSFKPNTAAELEVLDVGVDAVLTIE
jgi:hypothetical protein